MQPLSHITDLPPFVKAVWVTVSDTRTGGKLYELSTDPTLAPYLHVNGMPDITVVMGVANTPSGDVPNSKLATSAFTSLPIFSYSAIDTPKKTLNLHAQSGFHANNDVIIGEGLHEVYKLDSVLKGKSVPKPFTQPLRDMASNIKLSEVHAQAQVTSSMTSNGIANKADDIARFCVVSDSISTTGEVFNQGNTQNILASFTVDVTDDGSAIPNTLSWSASGFPFRQYQINTDHLKDRAEIDCSIKVQKKSSLGRLEEVEMQPGEFASVALQFGPSDFMQA